MDEMTIEILANGDFKVTTSAVSPANHLNAEQFVKFMADLAGGKSTRTRRGHHHAHTHQHEEEHEKH